MQHKTIKNDSIYWQQDLSSSHFILSNSLHEGNTVKAIN